MSTILSRRVRSVALAMIVMVSAIGALATPAQAATNQITIWKHTGAQTGTSYWEPGLNQPANYRSPSDFASGKAYLKLDVLSKPSSKSMIPAVCFWRHADGKKFKYETCARTKGMAFSKAGTYYLSLGSPGGWWKKNGGYDWTKRASVGRIMLKDPGSGKLFMSSKCGAACYRGGDLGSHMPVKMTGELIFVAKGATLAPPTGWKCPSAWSPQCSASGGSDPSTPPPGAGDAVTVSAPSSTQPSVTATPSTTAINTTWSAVQGAGKYQFRYKPDGAKMVWDKPTTNRSRNVTGLRSNTAHTIEVRALISGSWRDWTAVTVTTG